MNNQKIILISAGIGFLVSCKTTEVSNNPNETNENVTSSIDVNFMNNSIKPSEDFFLYANGTWVNNNPVPPSESRWGSFNELEQSNKDKLTNILDGFAANTGDVGSDAFILGNYYTSFIDMETRNKLGSSPIYEDIRKVQGIKSKSEIINVIAEHHKLGIGSLFSFGVGQDLKMVEKNISYLGQGGIGLPNRDYYLEDNKKDILAEYTKHISSTMQLLSYGKDDADKMAAQIVGFESQLAQAMMKPAEMRIPEKTYNKMSIKDARMLFGKIDFESYLSTIGSSSFDTLIVSQPDFIKTTNVLLENESLESWKNYLMWNVINHYAGSLDQSFVDRNFEFYGKVLSGKKEMKPIKERAIDEITYNDFGELLGKAFVERYFSKEAQIKVNVMVDNLLIVFQNE